MKIRFAAGEDIPALIGLLDQVGQVHHQGRPDLFRAGARKYGPEELGELLKEPRRPIFVAEQEGQVRGYGFCVLKETAGHPVLADSRELYIDDLCVDCHCRGRGIGFALYEHIRDYARAQGCASVTLNVWAFNESALRFYEKCGMRPQKIGMEQVL